MSLIGGLTAGPAVYQPLVRNLFFSIVVCHETFAVSS